MPGLPLDLLFLGHHAAVKGELTALENLQFASADWMATSCRARTRLPPCSRFGLQGREDLPVRFLSAGQKRRVLLARLVTRKAKLWILDEPFTALDTRAVQLLGTLVGEHLAEGGMAVVTSHQADPDRGRQGAGPVKAMVAVMRRDLLLAMRRKTEVLTALFFFVIVTSLFPLGIGPEPALLRKIAPGRAVGRARCWRRCSACSGCSLPTMPTARSSRWSLSPTPLVLLVAGKNAAHWLVSGLPLVVLAPLLGVQFDLDAEALGC